ncbi:zf-HC2 domain-containing protein [Phytohabitans suffuscus]|uniref:Putative zinc-finger domain-containing protein n=1 Tax=Phytohabitans suffuscus TaxID=624315 RepID=A0A6F8YKA7_9ACTN|nr:zf-HC2 domain-containing protein [Phytohabitans suffuscus]BCB86520.1 hypothetical protein Psuf_038330 [Phytohabitans suffuscus]
MRAGGEHSTAEQERLALYLLGVLDGAEREAFEEHLANCWRCLDEAAEVGPSMGGLAGLDDVDWEAPADPVAPPPVTQDKGPATREHGGGPVGPGNVRPGGARSSGARRGSRHRRLATWAGAAVAVVVLASAGAAVVNEWGGGADRVLTASGEAPGYGASLSVSITGGDEARSTIRITVTGLRPGIRYRLFAVTRDGATHEVRDWTASSGPQEVTGETSLSIDDLAFITVGQIDGSAIVTAPISRGPAAPR